MKTDLTVYAAGKRHPVEIDDENGEFSVYLGDNGWIKAPSYAELERKARRIKASFELPFSRVDSDGIRHGKVTGFHATNGNMLVKWDNGKTEQVHGYGGYGVAMPRLSTDEADEARRLVEARNRAVRMLDAFTDARKFDSLRKAAMDAQAKAVGDQ